MHLGGLPNHELVLIFLFGESVSLIFYVGTAGWSRQGIGLWDIEDALKDGSLGVGCCWRYPTLQAPHPEPLPPEHPQGSED
jgi:hypothetical protein